MSKDTQPPAPARVGIVGAGQLALMMAEAAASLNIEITVLAENDDDAAASLADHVVIGRPNDDTMLRHLASQVDVVTFDHELVDLDQLSQLEAEGVTLAPSPRALVFAVDKAYQRQTLRDAGIAVPPFVHLNGWSDEVFDEAAAAFDSVPVVKSVRGGYDGRGVLVSDDIDEARATAREWSGRGDVLLEQRVELLSEVAGLVATSADQRVQWPLVTTVQSGGMCVEVRFPDSLPPATRDEANRLVKQVAQLVNGRGVLAVELFVTPRGVLVNEVALRPHNSGHWTIEGSTTSQFANHLLGVLGRPLGDVSPLSPASVMVNVVGSTEETVFSSVEPEQGTYVHDYGKKWRPGRKLGHVTVVGDHQPDIRVRAWNTARTLKTSATEEDE